MLRCTRCGATPVTHHVRLCKIVVREDVLKELERPEDVGGEWLIGLAEGVYCDKCVKVLKERFRVLKWKV